MPRRNSDFVSLPGLLPSEVSLIHIDRSDETSHRNPHGDGRYVPILDGWRAVAILLVLLFHGMYSSKLTGYPRLQTVALFAGRTGALGVLVFFSISGYLITQRLLAETRARGMFSIRAFYIKRAFRILPPLAAYLLLGVILSLLGLIKLDAKDWSAAFFLTNYLKGSWYTSHLWSLSVEEHYYLFWPVCVVLIGWRRAMWVGLALILAVGAWRPWHLHHLYGASLASALQHTDMRIDYIMMGAVVAQGARFYPWTTNVLRRLGSSAGLCVLFLLLLASSWPTSFELRSVQAIIITLMVCASAMADASLPRLLLTNRPVLFLGKISYSLYVWQQLFLGEHFQLWWSYPSALPLKYAGALITAYLSYRFLETPCIRYGRRLLARTERPLATEEVEAA